MMTAKKLNAMAARIHRLHRKWWLDISTGLPVKRNKEELIMLVVTELSEAVEGIRRNLMDDKLPHRRMEEVEMADAYIRLMDYAGGFNLELVRYNAYSIPLNKAEGIFCIVKLLNIDVLSVSFALSQIEAYCAAHELDLFAAVEEKLNFNSKRKDHTHEHRRSENGKKF